MPDVVSLQLRLGLCLADHRADPLHLREGVAEDVIAGALEVVHLPLLVIAAALGDGEEAEVEAPGVEGGHLWLELGQHRRPLLDRHPLPAAGGGLNYNVAPLLYAGHDLPEELQRRARFASLGLPHVEVYDRRARLVGAYRRLDDLLRRDRDGRALPRYRHAAGDRRAYDDLLHDLYPFRSTRSPRINVKDLAEPPQTRFVSAPRECRRLMVRSEERREGQ